MNVFLKFIVFFATLHFKWRHLENAKDTEAQMRCSTLNNPSLQFSFLHHFFDLCSFLGSDLISLVSDQGSASPPPLKHANVFYQTQEPAQIFPMTDISITESSKGVAKNNYFFLFLRLIREKQRNQFFAQWSSSMKEWNALILFPGNSPWFAGYILKKIK